MPNIKITTTDQGSHGDHFGGVLGFNLLQTEEGVNTIYSLIQLAEQQTPVLENETLNHREAILNELTKVTSKVKVRIVQTEERIPTAYPILSTDTSIKFMTQEITEWEHIEHLEAEIYGQGKETFAIGFFATDYAVHKERYKNNENLDIKLSAIGLQLAEEILDDTASKSELKFSSDFATYMPNNNLPGISYYDFIGTVVDFEAFQILPDNSGYLIKIKLINKIDDPDFFTIELFINKENAQVEELKKGMTVSGTLWMQGEIQLK